MSKYLEKVYRKVGGKSHGKGHKVFNALGSAAVYGGASYAFGYLQNRYRERASVMGVPADLLAGGALSAVSLGCELMGKTGALSALARDVGNAGIGAFFHTLGAGRGAHAAGVTRLLLKNPAQLAAAKKAVPDAEVLGSIQPAPHGDFLTPAELAEMAK